MPGARMNSPAARRRRNSAALRLPAMCRPSLVADGLLRLTGGDIASATAWPGAGEGPCPRRRPSPDQTETGFKSFEPAALQKVVVSVVVWPFLVAVSSMGRHVLPSARVLGA